MWERAKIGENHSESVLLLPEGGVHPNEIVPLSYSTESLVDKIRGFLPGAKPWEPKLSASLTIVDDNRASLLINGHSTTISKGEARMESVTSEAFEFRPTEMINNIGFTEISQRSVVGNRRAVIWVKG